MIHNFASLNNISIQNGFLEVNREEIGKSACPFLLNSEIHDAIIPEEIYNLETMLLELTKK